MNDVTILNSDDISTIGRRIKYARKKQGLSQEELAEAVYIKREKINYIENDTPGRYLKSDEIVDIAKALNTSTDFLLGLVDNTSTDIEIKEIGKYLRLSEEAVIEISKMKNDKDILNYFFTETGFPELMTSLKKYKIICDIIKQYMPILALVIDYSNYIQKCIISKELKNIIPLFDSCEKTLDEILNLLEYCGVVNMSEVQYLQGAYIVLKEIVFNANHTRISRFDDAIDDFILGFQALEAFTYGYRKQLSFEVSEHFDTYVKGDFRLYTEYNLKSYKELVGKFISEHNENLQYFEKDN